MDDWFKQVFGISEKNFVEIKPLAFKPVCMDWSCFQKCKDIYTH